MKLAMLVRYFPPESLGGGEKYMEEVWKKAKEKYDVALISGWKNDPSLLPENTKHVKLKSKNRYFNYYNFYMFSKKSLKQINPDVVHASCYEIPIIRPTIITVCHLGHLMGHVDVPSFRSLQKKLSINRLKKASKIVAISNSTKNDLMRMGFKDVEVVYPGIDTALFKPKRNINDKFLFVYPSRISPEKGHHIIIKAVKELPKSILKEIEVILVGFISDQKYFENLKKESKDLPIKFETNVSSIVPYYQKADTILFPTLMYEGFGFTAAEGLACNKPVISSDFPSIREILDKKGILIQPGNHLQLSEAMRMIFTDKGLRKKISTGGHERIKVNFNWDQCFNRYDKIYQSLYSA